MQSENVVAVGARRIFPYLRQDVDQAGKFTGQLIEDGRQCLFPYIPTAILGEIAVGATPHGDVVVDVDQPAMAYEQA